MRQIMHEKSCINTTMTEKSDFSQRLREERLRLGLSQEDLAAMGGKGRNTVGAWERGEQSPNADFLIKAAEAGMDAAYLLTGQRGHVASNTLTDDEQTILAAWRSAAQSVRQAVRLMLAPVSVRELLDTETRMALKVIELAAPLALGGQMRRLAAA